MLVVISRSKKQWVSNERSIVPNLISRVVVQRERASSSRQNSHERWAINGSIYCGCDSPLIDDDRLINTEREEDQSCECGGLVEWEIQFNFARSEFFYATKAATISNQKS